MGPVGIGADVAELDGSTVVADASEPGVSVAEAEGDCPMLPEDSWTAGPLPPIVAPHSPQKRSADSTGAEHDGHATVSAAPHCTQNRRPSLFSNWQDEQFKQLLPTHFPSLPASIGHE